MAERYITRSAAEAALEHVLNAREVPLAARRGIRERAVVDDPRMSLSTRYRVEEGERLDAIIRREVDRLE